MTVRSVLFRPGLGEPQRLLDTNICGARPGAAMGGRNGRWIHGPYVNLGLPGALTLAWDGKRDLLATVRLHEAMVALPDREEHEPDGADPRTVPYAEPMFEDDDTGSFAHIVGVRLYDPAGIYWQVDVGPIEVPDALGVTSADIMFAWADGAMAEALGLGTVLLLGPDHVEVTG